jgi:Tfp pilus assembly protein PilN
MLVEINLLPEREHKNLAFLIVLSSIIAVILLGGVIYVLQGQSVKNQMKTIDRQISVVKKLIDKNKSHTETTSANNSASQLENAVKWANDYPIQTIPVMRKLTSLLPERGFIQSFGYTEDGTVMLSVQFDSSRDAAYFLSNLTNSQWIEDVSLNSLTAQAVKDPSNSAANTNNTSVMTNGTPTTVPGNSGATTTVPNTATGSQSAPPGNQSNQTSSSTGTNTQAADQSTSQATTGNSTTNDNLLPRYIGQFQIKLNHNFVKEQIKKSTSNQEGVTGS